VSWLRLMDANQPPGMPTGGAYAPASTAALHPAYAYSSQALALPGAGAAPPHLAIPSSMPAARLAAAALPYGHFPPAPHQAPYAPHLIPHQLLGGHAPQVPLHLQYAHAALQGPYGPHASPALPGMPGPAGASGEFVESHSQMCPYCARRFGSAYLLNKHVLRIHKLGAKLFPCDRCDKAYNVREDLVAHRRICGKVYACPCGVRAKQRNTIRRHCFRKDHPFAECELIDDDHPDMPAPPVLAERPSSEPSLSLGGAAAAHGSPVASTERTQPSTPVVSEAPGIEGFLARPPA